MDNVRMNMVIAIPQLFYDLIARVFPGFLFLSMICIFLNILENAEGSILANIWLKFPDNFWGSLYFGIAYFIFSYYIGWILSILSNVKPFYEYGVNKILDHYPEELKVNFQKIRLENESAGFRIVKLRAEAKMLEASRTGMCLIAALIFLVVIYKFICRLLFGINDFRILYQLSLIFVPLILAWIFQTSIKDAVDVYIKNIKAHYELIFGNDMSFF